MDLGEARKTVFDGALHVSPGTYDPGDADRAIRFIGNDFVEATHCTQTTTSVSLSSGTHVIDLTQESGMSGFLPTHWLWATIDGHPVKWAPIYTVERRYQDSTPTGRPQWIAFEGPDRATLYPEPDTSYTMRLFWWEPFTSITVATNTPESVELNIPDNYIDKVLRFGGAASMVYQDPDALYASQGWQIYQQHRAEVAAVFGNPPKADPAGTPTTTRHGGRINGVLEGR